MLFLFAVVALAIIVIAIVNRQENRAREEEVHRKYIESVESFEKNDAEFHKEIQEIQEQFEFEIENDIDGDIEDEYQDWCQAYSADIIGYKISGINFRHLDDSHLGEFVGTIKIEEGNPYDDYAVAIYRGRKKVGYIPREHSRAVFDELLKSNGSAECVGFIYTFIDETLTEKFAGRIIIGHLEAPELEEDTAI